MRKRIRKKVLKRAVDKVRSGQDLTVMEQRVLERELGYTLAEIGKTIGMAYDAFGTFFANVAKSINTAIYEMAKHIRSDAE